MEISMYKEEHFDQVLEIYSRAFSAPPINYTFITPVKAARYVRDITLTPGFLGYTFWDEQMVAFVFGVLDDYFDGTMFQVKEFAVRSDMHRSGVGTKAMGLLEAKLSGFNVDAINLNTSRLLPAYGFYRKIGYVEIDENVSLMKWML